ncbi:MAG: DUF4175 family protein [Maricaulaceae bacterium]|nr:DUF4175 family protein [Maricaulaceae bacterium]
MKRTALALAWLALLWERAAPVLWPLALAAGAYAALALFGLWEAAGDPWRALAALGILGAGAGFAFRTARRFRWPGFEDAARRVEEDSGLRARPHEALTDIPAAAGPADTLLWSAHRARMAQRLKDAGARRPKAAWAIADRWGLRAGLVILLALGWGMAGELAPLRLGAAFAPAPMITAEPARIDAWVDPPAYTRRPPLFLRDGQTEASAPAGSAFVVRVAGTRRAPALVLRTAGGAQDAQVIAIGDGVWEARATVTDDATAELRSTRPGALWRLTAIPDRPPEVRLTAAPTARANGELVLEFRAEDDYGVAAHALELRPEADDDGAWEAIRFEPSGGAGEDGAARAVIDVARHPLSGQRVTIRIAATDAAGQTGRSPSLAIAMPQRVFLDPLARAVAEQRRAVIAAGGDWAPLPPRPALGPGDVPLEPFYLDEQPERRIERAPEGLRRAARALDAVTDAPEAFFSDPVVYLGLRRALHRIRRAAGPETLDVLDEDLWLIALRAELGSLADAEAALRAAERALAEALARGAGETEMAPLFEAYREAMQNYLAALAREALEQGRFAEGGNGGMTLDSQAIQALLDALREAAELGDTAGARRALAALTELLRNMQVQLALGAGGGEDDPLDEAMREALGDLAGMIGEQRELQDRAFNLDRDENGNGGENGGLAGEQGDLASRLEALRDRVAGVSPDAAEALGGAGEPMRDAEGALNRGEGRAAVDAQERALRALREGGETLAREMMDRSQRREAGAAGQAGATDPLGRPTGRGGGGFGEDVRVPTEIERQRARTILEELRRRAAEQGRTREELDYIDRLLDRFSR